MSRQAAIADYGVVLPERLDNDSRSDNPAATGAVRTPRPSLAEVFVDRGPGYARLSGDVSGADADADTDAEVVGS